MKRIACHPSSLQIKLWVVLAFFGLMIPLFNVWLQLAVPATLMAICVGLLALLVFIDFGVGFSAPMLGVTRRCQGSLCVRVAHQAQLTFTNSDSRKLTFECVDMVPKEWRHESPKETITLNASESAQYRYTLTPQTRGAAQILGTQCKVKTALRFWDVIWLLECTTEHKVYPEFTAISDSAGLESSTRHRPVGLKRQLLRGSGLEFLHLRDFRQGDSIRQVNWRASSRFNKLISTEYQEEKNQHIIVMLDAGRRMRVQDDNLSYFDHALNAIIMLSYTALKNGDNVSVQSFGQESRWLSQVKGAQNVSRILNHFYDLYPQKVASDYLLAAQELIEKQPKRALVLLVSCLRDESYEDLLSAVKMLQAKHIVAVISVTEPIYKATSQSDITTLEDALMCAASAKLESSIEKNKKRLRQQGVMCIDAAAQSLTPSVLNTYLGIKKAGLI